MTKDKNNFKYVEGLLRSYKRNKSRIKVLERRMITDEDCLVWAIDYSRDNVQTSNLSSLDNKVLAREKELEELKGYVSDTEAMFDSLNTKDHKLIYDFYIENKSALKVASELGYYSETTFFRNRNRIINNLIEVIEG